MLKFLSKFFVFSLVSLGIGFVLDYAVNHGLKQSNYGLYKEWNDSFHGVINADAIIQGSSRAWVHVSPAILDSELHSNSYNLGVDGYDFHMQLCRYHIYRAHNVRPDFIIQVLGIGTLDKRRDLHNYEQFLPYLDKRKIREAITHYQGLNWLDYYIPLYRYRGLWENILVGVLEFFHIKEFPNTRYKGYEGMLRGWDHSFESYKNQHPNGVISNMDVESVQLFDEFLYHCKEEGIQVFLVYAPEYFEAQELVLNRESIIQLYQKLAKKYEYPFLDYSHDPLTRHKQWFYNSQHLNKRGAEAFSLKLAHDLKQYLEIDD